VFYLPCKPGHEKTPHDRGGIRTDLAIEAREMLLKEPVEKEMAGVDAETVDEGEVKIHRVRITTPQAAEKMGKVMGTYVTLEAPGLRKKDSRLQEVVSQALARELVNIMGMEKEAGKTVLVVGLGNWNVTPDALGPRVIQGLLVTRHILNLEPETLGEGFRPVSAISPGVLGLTGIETGEIVQGLVERVKPDMLLTVDALAARNIDRLHTTIQISDTGIYPGSGVGNHRLPINQETMGIPVFALGVPTVVDAVTIAVDAMDRLVGSLTASVADDSKVYQVLKDMSWSDKKELLSEVLSPYNGNLMVTPKEVDTLIEDTARLIAGGINAALHPNIDAEDASKYLH
jgi:spore protease